MTLRDLRTARFLSRDALAKAINVTYQTVATWENGERYPQMAQLSALAQFFGLSYQEITKVMDDTMVLKQQD